MKNKTKNSINGISLNKNNTNYAITMDSNILVTTIVPVGTIKDVYDYALRSMYHEE